MPALQLYRFYFLHQRWALLSLRYPLATVTEERVAPAMVEAYRKTFQGENLPDTADACISCTDRGAHARAQEVAAVDLCIAVPRSASVAALVSAYAVLKCRDVYACLNWSGSRLTAVQQVWHNTMPSLDFHFWVMYGSWSCCADCGSFFFNDAFFRSSVYQDQNTSTSPDLLALVRRMVPSDATEHKPGGVGVSSRWWYLPGMFKPIQYCGRCTRPPRGQTGGAFLTQALRRLGAARAGSAPPATRVATSELYRIPRVRAPGAVWRSWSTECITWPRYSDGEFSLGLLRGESMLDLTEAERQALCVVVLRTQVKSEKYGAAHHLNWTKVGMSRAYFPKDAVSEARMPSARAAAALRFLLAHNRYYRFFHALHLDLLARGAALNISSYNLFIMYVGVECAMYPVLYPTTDFTDTGALSEGTLNLLASTGDFLKSMRFLM